MSSEKEILDLEEKRFDAMIKGDLAALGHTLRLLPTASLA
jgi:hypothetical protein